MSIKCFSRRIRTVISEYYLQRRMLRNKLDNYHVKAVTRSMREICGKILTIWIVNNINWWKHKHVSVRKDPQTTIYCPKQIKKKQKTREQEILVLVFSVCLYPLIKLLQVIESTNINIDIIKAVISMYKQPIKNLKENIK